VYRALYPPPPKIDYRYGPTVYGRPYPGQPSYPRPTTYTSGPAYQPVPVDPPTAETALSPLAVASGSAVHPAPPIAAAPPIHAIPLPTQPTAPASDQAEVTRPMPPVGGVSPQA
jgi:hypothetical protein